MKEGVVTQPNSRPEHEEIHLPGPSIWPLLLALGIMLLLIGIVLFRGPMTVIGALAFAAALGGWLFEAEIARALHR